MFLKGLYDSGNLEGAILIGNVPIPMIRDAQHLTTAFKMDQKRDRRMSSVPSDRFYDDFDLRFDDLGEDSTFRTLHYYSLRSDSPQRIRCDIYSSRIKVPVNPAVGDVYEALSSFLDRAAEAKKDPEKLDNVLYFAGQGYNSDSYEARVDERGALMEQFPHVEKNGHMYFIDYGEDTYVKTRLLGALAEPDMDFAVLHHHGSEDMQFLNRTPYANTVSSYIRSLRRTLRGKVRDARDTAKKKTALVKEYGIPEAWVSDAFDSANMVNDSIEGASTDLYIDDLSGYVSNVRMLVIDACFNGAFNNADYIASHYLFNGCRTMVVKANSVNTLQDTWTNELMGLNGLGVCAGKWAMGQMTLESHLLGDATHRFECSDRRYDGLDAAMSDPKTDWKKYLSSDNPDVQCLAIKRLYEEGKLSSDDILEIQKKNPSELVRLEAFDLQTKTCDSNLEEAIHVALNDNYELTARLAAKFAEVAGFESLLPQLAAMALDPRTPERVAFHVRNALNIYPPDEVMEAEDSVRNATQNVWPSEADYATSKRFLESGWKSARKELDALDDKSASDKDKNWTIGAQRNKCDPYAVKPMLEFIADDGNSPERRKQAVEALGWFRYSCKKGEIVGAMEQMAQTERDEEVRDEMNRTLSRLK
jgi:hypothetical protein